jgi:NAD(P)-dependent dehydrogenase (short-subunit alcohol dehydrogenase family)
MNRNVLITGASRGIGLALTQHYKSQADNVYAVCRKPTNTLLDLGVNVIDGIDVSEAESIKGLVARLHDIPLDILINNAGVWGKECLGSIDYDNLHQVFNTNTLGPLRVTEALLSNMGSGSKVALITSRMGSISDNTSGRGYDYRLSKTALNMVGKTLAVDLEESGIAVAILHPGYVATDMVGNTGDITPDVAAERLAQRIEDLDLSNTGSFWHSNGELLPW